MENYRILLYPMGIRLFLSESLVQESNRKLQVSGKYWISCSSYRIWSIPTFSDVPQLSIGFLYQGFRRILLGSDKIL